MNAEVQWLHPVALRGAMENKTRCKLMHHRVHQLHPNDLLNVLKNLLWSPLKLLEETRSAQITVVEG